MTGVCEQLLSPGIAAYQQLIDAGDLCDMAPFDDNIEQICEGAAGWIANQALLKAHKKILFAVVCCCDKQPIEELCPKVGDEV